MSYQVVHRTRDRTIQRLGEKNRSAGRGDETSVDALLPYGFHELSNAGHRTLDEIAFVRDALARQHRGVERLCVAEEDVLRATRNEQMSRPVCEGVSSRGMVAKVPALILAFSSCESRKIIASSPLQVFGHSISSGTAINAPPGPTMIGSAR